MKTKMVAMVLIFLEIFGVVPRQVYATGDDKKKDPGEIGNRRVAHRSMISEEKEIAIGKQYASEIDKSAKIMTDPVINEYVNRVSQNIARNSDLNIPLTVKVIDSPGINAFALPGGFLYVNSGLLLEADSESQIAGVIAHEIAHVAARHWASQMTKATLARLATMPLLFIPMGYAVYYGIMEAYMNGIPLVFLKFSRDDEAEADYLGLQYLYKSGYDPQSYTEIFSKVIQEERQSPGSVPKIFMDHPPTPDRMLSIDQEMKQILPAMPQYLVSTSEFDDVKARLETLVTAKRKSDKQENNPTLKKREGSEVPGDDKTQQDKNKDDKKDNPPVLRRRDD
ncbi:MAG: M48 family metalloprotease [Patescibacteria group bacterium]|nr:M48 family metalloprotease [Patescibacteria group bacterium]MDE2015541.1 M48 family metalloprotease [Patescibacteria group bacterium]MDE2227263.1 M48 family metalloprotease [Patescibacteria group bacterium]